MLKKIALISVMVIGILVPIQATRHIALAQKTVAKTPDKLALGEDDVKQLLLLMDTSKTRKITKSEWMKFMEAEFDRLDKNKSGELDAKELAQSKLQVNPFAKLGK